MYPDHLNDEELADSSPLFDDIRALDRIIPPEHRSPRPTTEAPDECQLLNDVRAADKILQASNGPHEKLGSSCRRPVQPHDARSFAPRDRLNLDPAFWTNRIFPSWAKPVQRGYHQQLLRLARAPPFHWPVAKVTAPDKWTH